MPQVEMLEHNVALGRTFTPFSAAEMAHLRDQLAVSRPLMEKKLVGHVDGPTMAQAIERHPLDCVQMALNPSGNGSFEKTALVAAHKKKLGVIAMKVFGQDHLIGQEPGQTDPSSLLRFALSLPVTVAVSGMPQVEMLEHNVALGRTFTPFSAADMARLREELAVSRPLMEKKLVGHVDGPTDHPELFWV